MTLVNPNLGTENRKGALAVCAAFVDTLVVAVVVSALSMLRTGFVFGIENNLFHLPIVAGLQRFGAKTDFQE